MVVVIVGRQKPFDGVNSQLRFEIRRQIIDKTVGVGTDGGVRCVAAVDKERVSLIVPDNIGVGTGVRYFVDMLRDLTKFGAKVFVGLGMKEFIQAPPTPPVVRQTPPWSVQRVRRGPAE